MAFNSGHRDCINCGEDNSEDMFSFTRKFLNEVRGQSLEKLTAAGIGENFSTTIVKCKECGCDYIKDVANYREILMSNLDWNDDKLNNSLATYQSGFSRQQINHITYIIFKSCNNMFCFLNFTTVIFSICLSRYFFRR